MAWTTADRDRLQAAMATGAKRVEYDGPPRRMIEYQDFSEMRKALEMINRELGLSVGPVNLYVAVNKGI